VSKQIIRQPSVDSNVELYCIYSSIVGEIIWYDCTAEEIEKIFVKEAEEEASAYVRGIFEKLNKGENPYRRLGITYEEALEDSGGTLDEDCKEEDSNE